MNRLMDCPLGTLVGELLSADLDISLRKDLAEKRILLRVDLNIPLNEATGAITDASRVLAVLPTVRMLVERRAKVILLSHFERPDPKKFTKDQLRRLYSLHSVAAILYHALGPDVFCGLAPSCIGPEAEAAVAALENGQVVLLENTRFHNGDTANDPDFAAALAALCDVFVNDAFGVVHRDQGSVTGVALLAPEAYPGPLVRAELRAMAQYVLGQPARPLGVVLGGAKVADKIGVISALLEIADVIMVGGRMAFTLLAAEGRAVGSTQIEEEWLEPCRAMMARAAARGTQLLLPVDVLWSSSLEGPLDVGVERGFSSADKTSAGGAHGDAPNSPHAPPTPTVSETLRPPYGDISSLTSSPRPRPYHFTTPTTPTAPTALTTFLIPASPVTVRALSEPQVPSPASPTSSRPSTPRSPGLFAGPARYGVDIGPETAKIFAEEILRCRTICWSGPMGRFEVRDFSAGTLAVARAMDRATQRGAVTIVGGRDTVAAVAAAGVAPRVTHISTGGAAALELLAGGALPGLRVLLRGTREGQPPDSGTTAAAATATTAAAAAASPIPAGGGCCNAAATVAAGGCCCTASLTSQVASMAIGNS